jgi:CPA1 family monovalent cation:H+ antiporter
MSGGIHHLQFVVLLLLLCVAAFAALARKLQTPYPIVLVIAGLVISFIPKFPKVELNPDLIFFVVLPPLLYAAAWTTSWRDFSHNLTSILLLAIGLVTFTVFSVAALAPRIVSIDWRSGFILGAVVATTDAIAATSISRRLGVARRIVDVVEGESLVNDATGLLALQLGLAMVLRGQSLNLSFALLRLGQLAAIGIGVGIAVGFVIDWLERQIEDASIEITISFLVPYAAYLTAEELKGSGVLAVVTCGLLLSRRSARFFSPTVRMQVNAVWAALTFILNGFVFVLIGLQLPSVVGAIPEHRFPELIIDAAQFSALVIGLRLLWVFPGAYLSQFIRVRFLKQNDPLPSPRAIFIVGWTGMRGVIALAAALSLPAAIAQRNIIVFLTFSVILVTLVLQGLTLAPLIRALRVGGQEPTKHEVREARVQMLEAALQHLDRASSEDLEKFADVYEDLASHFRTRLATLLGEGADEHGSSAEHDQRYGVSRQLISVERETAIHLRDQGRISDESLSELLNELDLEESHLATT